MSPHFKLAYFKLDASDTDCTGGFVANARNFLPEELAVGTVFACWKIQSAALLWIWQGRR